MKEMLCDSCGQEMKLQKNFGVKKRGQKQKQYRVRRFHCDLCDLSRTIFADGYKDEFLEPLICKEVSKQLNPNALIEFTDITKEVSMEQYLSEKL